MPLPIPFVESALYQVVDHGKEFIQCLALCGHFRLVKYGNQYGAVVLYLKDELFFMAKTCHGCSCYQARATSTLLATLPERAHG